MATAEAVERRRANRRARTEANRNKAAMHEQATVSAVVRTGLTRRAQRILQQYTDPLFECGTMDVRYMGIRFLELFALGWTPMRYVLIDGQSQMRGVWCSDIEFEEIWNWWNWLHYETRASVIGMARASSRV